MKPHVKTPLFWVWGTDRVVYGPLEPVSLTQWIQEKRITPTSWIFLESDDRWEQAAAIPALQVLFAAKPAAPPAPQTAPGHVQRWREMKPETLRRIKVFASFDDRRLHSFIHYMEVVPLPQFSHIVRKGEHGDAMYLILEGELRALTIVEGKESTLTTMTAGDCFGEMSLLDQGPRSVDVVANRDSVLLKLSSAAFDRLVREAPALAVPFLLALSRAVVERVRRTTKRYEDSIRFIRTSSGTRAK